MDLFNHPTEVCMTYFQHMKFSLYLSYTFSKAAMCALCHAIYPDIFITHSSDTISKLSEEMKKIGCRKEKKDS